MHNTASTPNITHKESSATLPATIFQSVNISNNSISSFAPNQQRQRVRTLHGQPSRPEEWLAECRRMLLLLEPDDEGNEETFLVVRRAQNQLWCLVPQTTVDHLLLQRPAGSQANDLADELLVLLSVAYYDARQPDQPPKYEWPQHWNVLGAG